MFSGSEKTTHPSQNNQAVANNLPVASHAKGIALVQTNGKDVTPGGDGPVVQMVGKKGHIAIGAAAGTIVPVLGNIVGGLIGYAVWKHKQRQAAQVQGNFNMPVAMEPDERERGPVRDDDRREPSTMEMETMNRNDQLAIRQEVMQVVHEEASESSGPASPEPTPERAAKKGDPAPFGEARLDDMAAWLVHVKDLIQGDKFREAYEALKNPASARLFGVTVAVDGALGDAMARAKRNTFARQANRITLNMPEDVSWLSDRATASMVMPMHLEEYMHAYQSKSGGFLSRSTGAYKATGELERSGARIVGGQADYDEIDVMAKLHEWGFNEEEIRYVERYSERKKFWAWQQKQTSQLKAMGAGISQVRTTDKGTTQLKAFQPPGNSTGMPDELKTGVERLSGFDLSDVKVHYNSSQPAQLNAYAYAQGADIHLGPGQEKHLPHEAWHVVQQKQGRVQPTAQLKSSVPVNDDPALEQEADMMGMKALEKFQGGGSGSSHLEDRGQPVQAMMGDVAQLERIEPRGINGLTHLVKMTDEGHIYNAEDWLANEREEVSSGDLLMVDLDDAWYSHRGMDQEVNWQLDGEGPQDKLWVNAVELNHKRLGKDRYVRDEMLKAGVEEIPKTIHSVWAQGDFMENPEAREGMKTREGRHIEGWTNMIWLYNTGHGRGGFDPGLLHDAMPLNTGRFGRVFERNFLVEMEKWRASGKMPAWVAAWLPILDVLMSKRSYITMSDIMRMIILFYEGGVYMDVKVQVKPEKADFSSKPMLLINTANFYDRENWAIMASAGCRMIEEIMVQTLAQFPKVEELKAFPMNYQGPPGKEGKTHAQLHEHKGPWNIIERYRKHSGQPTLSLRNPRPVNSWADAYEDRDPAIVREELRSNIMSRINVTEGKIRSKESEKRNLETAQHFVDMPAMWLRVGLTAEKVKTLPEDLEKVDRQIGVLQNELFVLLRELPGPEPDELPALVGGVGDQPGPDDEGSSGEDPFAAMFPSVAK